MLPTHTHSDLFRRPTWWGNWNIIKHNPDVPEEALRLMAYLKGLDATIREGLVETVIPYEADDDYSHQYVEAMTPPERSALLYERERVALFIEAMLVNSAVL